MIEFKIRYTRNDMPEGYVGESLKWAHSGSDAVNLLLQKKPEKNGTCVFKRGGAGKILSVEDITTNLPYHEDI